MLTSNSEFTVKLRTQQFYMQRGQKEVSLLAAPPKEGHVLPEEHALRAHSALETVHGEQDSSVSEWEEGRQEGKRERDCKANTTWLPP